ncbi:hypothetical protein ACEN8K_47185, partial [Variovorax sp. CT11-76]
MLLQVYHITARLQQRECNTTDLHACNSWINRTDRNGCNSVKICTTAARHSCKSRCPAARH